MMARTLAEITANGMCLGCGLCAGVLKRPAIRMEIAPDGYLRPAAVAALDGKEESLIAATCPGIVQQGAPEPGVPVDEVWGPVRATCRAHAADEELRFTGSSGGVISGVVAHLLETGAVDAVLHVAADPDQPLRSVIQVSRTRADVLEAAAARYGPAGPLATIGNLLDSGETFAFAGKPCDVAGLRNLARIDPRVNERVPYMIAFFCAGVSSLNISEAIVAKYGLKPDDVRELRYRGHGCPGPTRIAAKDGRVFEQSYDETWSGELAQDIQFRCKICPDSTGEQADISCGDAWESDDGYAHAEQEGWSAVIARTAKGERLLKEMAAAGRLVAEPFPLARIARAQPHQVARKQAVAARLAGLKLAGAMLPSFRNLRLARNALTGAGDFRRNMAGAGRRWKASAAPPQDETRNGPVPYLLAAPLALFCLFTVLLPMASIVVYSFWSQDYLSIDRAFTLKNYAEVLHSALYLWLIAKSLLLAATVTVICILLALPVAYFIVFRAGRVAPVLLLAFLLPYWTSYLLRVFAWKVLLGFNGIVNSGLIALGLIREPIEALLYSPVSVVIALVHAWLPFAILPIYASMSRIDRSLVEASRDLGAGSFTTFRQIVLPLSASGIAAAAVCAFIPILVDYVTPALVGGPAGAMIGNVVYAQFTRSNNWPLGSAISISTMLAMALCLGAALLAARARRKLA